MNPTLDQIAAMEARGWMWDIESRSFHALSARDSQGSPILMLRLIDWGDGGWMPSYGVPGIGYGQYRGSHADPLIAADACESWLRTVLSGFSPLLLRRVVPLSTETET